MDSTDKRFKTDHDYAISNENKDALPENLSLSENLSSPESLPKNLSLPEPCTQRFMQQKMTFLAAT